MPVAFALVVFLFGAQPRAFVMPDEETCLGPC